MFIFIVFIFFGYFGFLECILFIKNLYVFIINNKIIYLCYMISFVILVYKNLLIESILYFKVEIYEVNIYKFVYVMCVVGDGVLGNIKVIGVYV